MPLPRLSGRPPAPGQYTAPGALNRRITFYNPPDPSNGIEASAFCDAWAAKRALSGQEMEKAQQIAQRANYLFTVRYQPGILESMQIEEYEAGTPHTFEIANIEDPDGRCLELRIMAFEINQNAGSAS